MSPKKEPPPIPTLEEFLAACRTECEFLVREYGFEILEAPMEYNDFSVRFRKGDLEVDVYGENYGQNASCDLVRGEDRLYFGFLMLVEERQSPKRKRVRLGQLEQVKNIAAWLQLHASDFLGGDFRRFDSGLAEWKRMIQPRQVTEEERAQRELARAVTVAGHASKLADYAEVVRLLEPHADSLSPHQRRMLEAARERFGETEPTLDVVLKRFESPDEVRVFSRGRFDLVTVGGVTIGRATYEPGWRWSVDVGPTVGAQRCRVEHVGLVLQGRATAAFADGRVWELVPGTLFHIPAEPHDSWVLGDEPYVSLHFLGADHYAK